MEAARRGLPEASTKQYQRQPLLSAAAVSQDDGILQAVRKVAVQASRVRLVQAGNDRQSAGSIATQEHPAYDEEEACTAWTDKGAPAKEAGQEKAAGLVTLHRT